MDESKWPPPKNKKGKVNEYKKKKWRKKEADARESDVNKHSFLDFSKQNTDKQEEEKKIIIINRNQ